MKKIGLLAWILTFVLAACQSSTENNQAEVTHLAEIEVEGMTCEMGCGADIRKALKNYEGILKVDFDFQEDREVNIAKVQFDAKLIKEDEMRQVISSLNKGQFSVGEINTKPLSSNESEAEKTGKKESSSGVKMNNSMISVSDVVGIVAAWFF